MAEGHEVLRVELGRAARLRLAEGVFSAMRRKGIGIESGVKVKDVAPAAQLGDRWPLEGEVRLDQIVTVAVALGADIVIKDVVVRARK